MNKELEKYFQFPLQEFEIGEFQFSISERNCNQIVVKHSPSVVAFFHGTPISPHMNKASLGAPPPIYN